ncbi:MAG: threonine--tRNA ligase [Phycisphaeraceae bacterium]|nr:threonine--tRNA ligase [Phycisphaeraceae bacterium]
MRITLPDGSVREYAQAVTAGQVAADIGAGLAKAAIGAKVGGVLTDLNRPITADATLAIVTKPRQDKQGLSKGEVDPEALYLLRHSTAHVMAEAVCRLWPDAKLAYGPPVDSGFYYDIALETPISSDDFPRIEAEMKKIVEENRPFTRYELPPEEGMKRLEAEGNKYKIDNAQRAITGGAKSLSWYATGQPNTNWEDLCMGPHVPATGAIAAFKVTSVASSHWHGDVNSDRFQRLYGTAFFSQADLEQHQKLQEEAKQRDHRLIGTKLGLFTIDEQVGQGLILWKAKGGMLRTILEDFLRAKLLELDYSIVYTPHIGKIDLYKTSGHYPYYADSQFPPIKMRDSDDEYLLKPMNCPHHCKIFASDPHSYRDLPVRLAEFGTVYRFEQSGELSGLTRVRGFTQDDAHIFCTHEQVPGEFAATIQLVQFVFKTFGFDDVHIRLSLRDPSSDKYVGDPRNWERAESQLRQVLRDLGMSFTEAAGEAAFYGPKVDFIVRDVIGRKWQLGTVQLDYNLPERFKLEYVGQDNAAHRPAMIHRAPFGSMERFTGILIEHYAGAFPLWISPEQFRVLPVSDKFNEYAMKVHAAIKGADFRGRAAVDLSNERVNAKIKVAQDDKVPYMLVVGGRDQEAGAVSVRDRVRGDLGAMPLAVFIEKAGREIASHGVEVVKA